LHLHGTWTKYPKDKKKDKHWNKLGKILKDLRKALKAKKDNIKGRQEYNKAAIELFDELRSKLQFSDTELKEALELTDDEFRRIEKSSKGLHKKFGQVVRAVLHSYNRKHKKHNQLPRLLYTPK
jgi:signal recognition particle GTPase